MGQTPAFRFGVAVAALIQYAMDRAFVTNSQTAPAQAQGLSAIVPGLSLSAKFALAATILLCNGMALLGGWVVTEIEKGLLQTFATEEAAYVRSLLEPITPMLVSQQATATGPAASVDELMNSTLLGDRLAAIAVWRPDGSVAYSTDKALIGRTFPLTTEIRTALQGEIKTSLWDKRLFGVYGKRPNDKAVRTIYAPLRERGTGTVLAVVEIADNAGPSKAQMEQTRRRTWTVVGLSTLLMIVLLFGIVHSGSRTIDQQRSELQRRYEEQARLAQANKELSERLQASNRDGIELGEQLLRRVGLGLQDGPVHLLGLGLRNISDLRKLVVPVKGQRPPSPAVGSTLDAIEVAITGALEELKAIDAGLALPELSQLTVAETLTLAVKAHERATRSTVDLEIGGLPDRVSLPITISIFRIAEEGLSNAFQHAGGRGQRLAASSDSGAITITICDAGPGMSPESREMEAKNLGLRGLRQRVESIGGRFDLHSTEGQGTRLSVVIPYTSQDTPS